VTAWEKEGVETFSKSGRCNQIAGVIRLQVSCVILQIVIAITEDQVESHIRLLLFGTATKPTELQAAIEVSGTDSTDYSCTNSIVMMFHGKWSKVSKPSFSVQLITCWRQQRGCLLA